MQGYHPAGDVHYVKQAFGHSHVTITERCLKFPLDYLQQVFGESIKPYHTDQRGPILARASPPFRPVIAYGRIHSGYAELDSDDEVLDQMSSVCPAKAIIRH